MSEAAHDAPGTGRTILVGVTGGIAIYKAVELVRGLVKDGFQPLVVTTEAAKVSGITKRFAASVVTTKGWKPSLTRPRTSSTAL